MEKCRNCGKPIASIYPDTEGTVIYSHYVDGVVYKYCDRGTYISTRKQKDRVAEPPTKNEIVYAILKDL